MHYGNNKPKYIRYAIYAAIICVACVLQNTNMALPELFGARAFLLLPLCVCIAMYEREFPAAMFGAFAGILWDISAFAEGFNALSLMVLCTVCSIFINRIMQNNIVTALFLSSGTILIYEILYVIVNLGFTGAGGMLRQGITFYLPSFFYTLVFIPIFYFIVKKVYTSYKTE